MPSRRFFVFGTNCFLIASTVLAAWSASAAAEAIKVGVTPGPHAQIFEVVKPIAAAKGLDIKIIEFSDYVVPNTALADGALEANSFQNTPYLDNQKAGCASSRSRRSPRP